MPDEAVCRYLNLVDRRLFILTHSGIDWKPEYEVELETIDRELGRLRVMVDQEHERRQDICRYQETVQCLSRTAGRC